MRVENRSSLSFRSKSVTRGTLAKVGWLLVCVVILAGAAVAQTIPTAQLHSRPRPWLADVVRLSNDVRSDFYPTIAFSPSSPHGLVVWAKVDGWCDEMFNSHWDGTTWQAETYVPNQQNSGRHRRPSVSFDPLVDSFLVTFSSSVSSYCGQDEIDSRSWQGAWDSGGIRLGDGVNDDDHNGTVRHSANGLYAFFVWEDNSFWADPNTGAIKCSVWDSTQLSWGATQTIQPASGPLPYNTVAYDRSLEQDLVRDVWVVAYHKSPADTSSESTASEVAYQVGVADLSGWTSISGERQLTNDVVHDGVPVVSFSRTGQGAIFWNRRVGAGDNELMAARWDPVSLLFGAPVQLTFDSADNRLYDAIPGMGGWHVIYTKQLAGASSPEIYYGWFDGSSLSSPVRLTFNSSFEGHLVNGYRASGIEGASAHDGRIFLTWSEWDGSNTNTKEVHVGELRF